MNSRIFYFFIVLVFFTTTVSAQINDNFSDGNLTNNPAWQGNMDKFQVVNEILQSNGDENQSPIYLSTPNLLLNDGAWKFKVKLNFNPSSNNYVRIYLVSDKADLTSSTLSGYYIRMGESLSEDGIDLFKQNADGSVEKIIDGTAGQVAAKPDISIKVVRSAAGNWEIMADLSGGDNFSELVGAATDNEFIDTAFFGVVCNYTNSNAQNFFFDDFVIESAQDNKPPEVVSVIALSEKLIGITFSESLDLSTAQNVNNYSVNQSIGKPISATLIGGNKVQLEFINAFSVGISHTISINNVSDQSANILLATALDFIWLPPVSASFRDVVINEIFADPSPPLGLPDSEFIEIYNPSNKTINLKEWAFSDPIKTAILPSYILSPNAYLILCPEDEVTTFTSLGNVIGVSPWPTLNNSGDNILLKDKTGKIIDSVNYKTNWYQDTKKSDGGWSLEQINPATMCNSAQNWRASTSVTGGTPSKENAVFDPSSDVLPPKLLTVVATSTKKIQLVFDEAIDKSSAENANYTASPEIQIIDVQVFTNDINIVSLALATDLEQKIAYEISVENITDCEGNIIRATNNTATFSLPESADSLDIVINEVLFNPRPGGVDFVEIFNRSDKSIDLINWKIANTIDTALENAKTVSMNHLILTPKSFLAFTVNAQILKADYPSGKESNFIEMSLPSFPDEKGSIILLNNEGAFIDLFDYNEDYHFSLIKNSEGVSLERITADAPTNDANNWHSAASTAGYATPGYVNSQSIPDNTISDKISISPKVFLPDNSGIDDFTTISYNFETNGFVANISIFDVAGRKVRTIAKNELLAQHGFYTWDGTSDNRTKVNIGYYIVFFEIFNLQGKVLKFKKTVAVAGKF